MRGIIFDNLDINVFLDEKDLTKGSLECVLENDFGSNRVLFLHKKENQGNDGVKVDFENNKYYVKLSSRVVESIRERGEFETRYGMGEKIAFYVDRQS
jgi:hypothetical protein